MGKFNEKYKGKTIEQKEEIVEEIQSFLSYHYKSDIINNLKRGPSIII